MFLVVLAPLVASCSPTVPTRRDVVLGIAGEPRAILSDDARGLANQLDMEVLQQLQTAIEPLADIRSMKFVGAVEKGGRVLAAYVAGGKTSDGTDVLVGFVLNVTGDQIVGVN